MIKLTVLLLVISNPLPTVRIDPVGIWEYTIPKFSEVVYIITIRKDGTFHEEVKYRSSGRALHSGRAGTWKFSGNTLTFAEAGDGFREYFRVYAKSNKNTIYCHWRNNTSDIHSDRVNLRRIK